MRSSWLLTALALVACSSQSPKEPEPSTPSCDETLPAPADVPAVAVLAETKEDQYVPLEADAVLLRHSGPQGGQHFWLRVRVYSPDERLWSFDATLLDAAANSVASGARGVTACAGTWTKLREVTVFLEQLDTPLSGTLKVEVTSLPDVLSFETPVSVP